MEKREKKKMIKWRYARYGFLMLFGSSGVLAIWAILVNPVQLVGLSVATCFCIFIIYGILANWNDENEENATKKESKNE